MSRIVIEKFLAYFTKVFMFLILTCPACSIKRDGGYWKIDKYTTCRGITKFRLGTIGGGASEEFRADKIQNTDLEIVRDIFSHIATLSFINGL